MTINMAAEDTPKKRNKYEEEPESSNDTSAWKLTANKPTNAERYGRPATKDEIRKKRWREKQNTSVKSNTVKAESIDLTAISLQFLESWNEYCAGMDALNEHVFKSFFKNSIEAGRRLRTTLRRQKALINLLQKTSRQYEQHLSVQRKEAKEQEQLKKSQENNSNKKKFVLVDPLDVDEPDQT